MTPIAITPTTDMRFSDLMRAVDFSTPPCLMDVLSAIVNSSGIPREVMQQILHCNCLQDLWEEAKSKQFQPIDRIQRLEIAPVVEHAHEEDGESSSSFWHFCGVNDSGNSFSLAVKPMWKISGYKIGLAKKISLVHLSHPDGVDVKEVRCSPSISLVDFLYYIIQALTFYGGPREREMIMGEILKTVKDELDSRSPFRRREHVLKFRKLGFNE